MNIRIFKEFKLPRSYRYQLRYTINSLFELFAIKGYKHTTSDYRTANEALYAPFNNYGGDDNCQTPGNSARRLTKDTPIYYYHSKLIIINHTKERLANKYNQNTRRY